MKPPSADTPAERLAGSVERVNFHSEESGFCVLRVKDKEQRELVTVIGLAAWTNDRIHGMQFKANLLKVVPPSTLEGIEKYLGSGMVKGIGPHFAKVLVKAFRENVFTVIEKEPDKLLTLPGIGKKLVEKITSAWAEQKVIVVNQEVRKKASAHRSIRLRRRVGESRPV